MRFPAVIFDMDGLMLDSERIYREVFDRAAADCDIHFSDELFEQMLGRNAIDSSAILRAAMNNDELFERFWNRSRHHHSICFEQTPPPIKRGLMELLDLIEQKNVVKVVATSTRRQFAIPRLERAGLLHRFKAVTTGDQVQHGKPAPEIFLLAAGTIPMEPQRCIVLEDSEAGVRAAHAAGMSVCMVPDLKQPTDDVRSLAQGVYESLVEVRHYLSDVL